MQYDWGPHYIVPCKGPLNYSGRVSLRENFDMELLRRQLYERKLSARNLLKVKNLWFYRRKNSEMWTKIGESDDIGANFAVRWDTTGLENGQYEIIGFMQAFVKEDDPKKWAQVTLANGEYEKSGYRPIPVKKNPVKRVIGEQNIIEITVKN